jgi:hypothetical protein
LDFAGSISYHILGHRIYKFISFAMCTSCWAYKYVFLGLVSFLAAWALMSIDSIWRNLRLLPTGVEPSMNTLRGLDPLQWAKRKIDHFVVAQLMLLHVALSQPCFR